MRRAHLLTYSGLATNKKMYKTGEKIYVSIKIKNTGHVAGKEAVQFYINKESSSISRADKELKGFEKLTLASGETKIITIAINVADLAYFGVKRRAWVVEPGSYNLLVASSAKDILKKVVFAVLK